MTGGMLPEAAITVRDEHGRSGGGFGPSAHPKERAMRSLRCKAFVLPVFASMLVLCLPPRPAEAGIRGPGKYSGVVVYDRWGGCTLYSGVYVMYVSEKVKGKLCDYPGKSVQVDAREVLQLINP